MQTQATTHARLWVRNEVYIHLISITTAAAAAAAAGEKTDRMGYLGCLYTSQQLQQKPWAQ